MKDVDRAFEREYSLRVKGIVKEEIHEDDKIELDSNIDDLRK